MQAPNTANKPIQQTQIKKGKEQLTSQENDSLPVIFNLRLSRS